MTNPSEPGLFTSRDHIMKRVAENKFKSLCNQHEQTCRFPNNAVNATVTFQHHEAINHDKLCGNCKRILNN